ncbi:hypothetical protein [Rhodanobacter sp. MP7CTX1]|uniref:hypothetical protein n=1 Tax=Rhodanobacter sp. MP7CTX1 TaxID=2723084 RepID=UPI00162306E3|nr:hypothetical protein [Rhodanobacter sp. MP7CTX1]MBB6188043.1 hypothetical protein [Rhodanobacter sp. MP7CTX1]
MPKFSKDDSHSFFSSIAESDPSRRMSRMFYLTAVIFLFSACAGAPRAIEPPIPATIKLTSTPAVSSVAPDTDLPKRVSTNQIDRTFTAAGDLTGDGSEQHLTIHVTGHNMTSAFTWSLVITGRNGVTLFRVERNDAWLDSFFGQDGYEADCSGYMACKKHYYFEDLPKTVFESLNPTDAHESKNDLLLSNLRETATAFFIKNGVPSSERDAAISEMRRTLTRPGFRVLDVPYSPVEWSPPAIWVKSIHMFVPYHQD